jgi:FkbM family methyltransferase
MNSIENLYKSQFSQDKFLNENIFKNQRNGRFVEIGAHDGITGSNTYFFEKALGWTGLAIEPILDRYVELCKNRNCICFHGCVFHTNQAIDFLENTGYTEMLSGILSCQDNRHIQRLESEKKMYGGESKIVKKQAYTLTSLLLLHNMTKIDYLSVDTEGSEYEVLLGIDFGLIDITVIDVENNYPDSFSKIHDLLLKNGFEHVIRLGGDEIYIKR